MVSLSCTYPSNSKYQHRPSPWPLPPNSYSEASRFCLLPFSSPATRSSFFSLNSNQQFCSCSSYSSGVPVRRQRSVGGLLSHDYRRIRSFRPGSSGPMPSPTPPSDPPPRRREIITGALTRMQDTARIFFAVFLWMALFFWASVWDGRNGGRHDKGTRFKR